MRWVGVLLGSAVLAGVMAYLAGMFHPKLGQELATPATDVGPAGRIVVVESVQEPVVEQAVGTVRAKDETVASSRITAAIVAVNVRPGDSVGEGDVLIELDQRELQARLAQQRQLVAAADARLSEAVPNFERVKRLAGHGAASTADVERAEAVLDSARADLARTEQAVAEARTALSYATITAPLSGRVIERFADPGDTATPGAPLLALYDPDKLRLEADVRESVAAGLRRGQRLTARIDALDRTFEVAVDEIVPAADPGSRSFVVKTSLPSAPNLYPGMFGRLLIETGTAARTYVPRDAITRVGQLEFVMVMTPSGPVRRYVRTGARGQRDRVEVLSGLRPGEELVAPGG